MISMTNKILSPLWSFLVLTNKPGTNTAKSMGLWTECCLGEAVDIWARNWFSGLCFIHRREKVLDKKKLLPGASQGVPSAWKAPYTQTIFKLSDSGRSAMGRQCVFLWSAQSQFIIIQFFFPWVFSHTHFLSRSDS